MTKISKEQAEGRLKADSEKVTKADVQTIVDRADDIRKTFEASGPLGRFVTDAKLMLSVVKDYWDGSYREIPWWAIAAVVAALLYVLSPIDLIPDPIPILGQLDDAAVVTACLLLVEQQLREYQQWKCSRTD